MNRQFNCWQWFEALQEWPACAQSAAVFLRTYAQAWATGENQLTGWSLDDRDPAVIESLLPFFGWVYRHYFHVQTDGWEQIPAGQVMLIGSHNGGLAAPDTVMMTYDWFMRYGTARPVYGLMDSRIWQAMPGTAHIATRIGTVHAHPRMAIAALDRGASVLIYPGGARDVFRPHSLRHQVCLGDNMGFVKLALQKQVPIVPVISQGAHSTLIVLADLYPWLQQLHERGMPWLMGIDPSVFPIYLGLPWGLAIGPLPNMPLPMPIHTRVCPPITFERYGVEAAHDRAYVQQCHDRVQREMQMQLDQLVAEVAE